MQNYILLIAWLLAASNPATFAESIDIEWTKSTPMPEPRSGYAAGVLNGKLIVAGGTFWLGQPGNWTKKEFTASTHAFDPVNETWQQLPDALYPFGYAASEVVGDRLYVLGGYNGKHEMRKVIALEKRGDVYTWTNVGQLPVNLLFSKAVTVDSKIYLLGGTTRFEPHNAAGGCCTSRSATRDLMVWDPSQPSTSWGKLPPYPGHKRFLYAAAADDQAIWLFGGRYQDKTGEPVNYFQDVLRYRVADQSWEKVAVLPDANPRARPFTAISVGNDIMLMCFAKHVWQFDPCTFNYRPATELPEEVAIDRYYWLDQRIVGTGGENRVQSPRNRSETTWIGRISR